MTNHKHSCHDCGVLFTEKELINVLSELQERIKEGYKFDVHSGFIYNNDSGILAINFAIDNDV